MCFRANESVNYLPFGPSLKGRKLKRTKHLDDNRLGYLVLEGAAANLRIIIHHIKFLS